MTIALNELWTGVAALATILLGVRINRWIPAFTQYSILPAVTRAAGLVWGKDVKVFWQDTPSDPHPAGPRL